MPLVLVAVDVVVASVALVCVNFDDTAVRLLRLRRLGVAVVVSTTAVAPRRGGAGRREPPRESVESVVVAPDVVVDDDDEVGKFNRFRPLPLPLLLLVVPLPLPLLPLLPSAGKSLKCTAVKEEDRLEKEEDNGTKKLRRLLEPRAGRHTPNSTAVININDLVVVVADRHTSHRMICVFFVLFGNPVLQYCIAFFVSALRIVHTLLSFSLP